MKRLAASSCYNEEMPLMRSGIALYNNVNAPAAIVKDIETRLQVVTKVVPQEEVNEAYNAFVQKLNGMCYEKLAEQLVRPAKPASSTGAPSVYDVISSQNIQSSRISNKLYSANPTSSKVHANSTCNNIMKAAAEVKKQKLAAINETANSATSISSQRQKRGRAQKSTIPSSPKSSIQDTDETYQYFRVPKVVAKPSRPKAVSVPKQRKKYTEQVSVTAAELTITKSSLRSNSSVVYTTTQRRNYKKVRATKATVSEKDVSVSSNSSLDDSVQTSRNSFRRVIGEKPKKTALSPFFNRMYKHRINASSTPLGKF